MTIQSPEGQRLLEAVPEDIRLDSFHLVEEGEPVASAGAAVAPLLQRLPAGWPLAAIARRFPVPTERAYRFIAGHRTVLGRMLRRFGAIPPPAG